MEALWRLTSPNAGPGDWIGTTYDPPFEYPFRVVSATMFYLDSFCCTGSICGDPCSDFVDWDRMIIGRENIAIDSAGLTPDIANPIAQVVGVRMIAAGSNRTSPPWILTPYVWTLPGGTIFDSPGRIFFAIKYLNGDQFMNFAVDNTSTNQGTSIFSSDSFSTRASIWAFGNVGMRVQIAPLFSLKGTNRAPATTLELSDATSVAVLSFRISAGESATTINSIRLTASGSGHDATDIAAVRLVLDSNANGVEDPAEIALASGAYGSNNGTVLLSPGRTLATGAAENWLVVYDLAGSATGGETFTARIASGSDVSSNLGTPYVSGTLQGGLTTVAGRLFAERGPMSPGDRIVPAGAQGVTTLQLRLRAENEDFNVSSITFTADGNLNDATGIASVRLFRDADRNGIISAGDSALSQGNFPIDDGRLTLPLSTLVVPSNQSVDLIATYDLTAVAAGGNRFRTLLALPTDIAAAGTFSGPVPPLGDRVLTGPPVIGSVATVGGSLTAALGAASPADGTAQPNQLDLPLIQLALSAAAEAVDVTSVTFEAFGSGDELDHVGRVRLWRDANGNGAVDGLDTPIGTPSTYGLDNGQITFAFAPETVPQGATRLWLLTYDMNGVATGGEQFAVRVAAGSAITARGQASSAPLIATGNFALISGTRTMLGGFSAVTGPESPAASQIQPGSADVPVLQIRLAAQGETFSVSRLRITPAGSMDDRAGVAQVTLLRDAGTGGLRDPADVVLATATFPADDTAAVFDFTPPLDVQAGTLERWLITYDFTAQPRPGETFRASIVANTDMTVRGSLSGAATALGLPVAGETHSIGGTLTISAGPNNPAGGTVSPGASDIVVLQVRLTAGLEPITVSSVTLTGAGTGNEITDVANARLLVDADRDGVLDPIGDIDLGTAMFAANDGTIVFTFVGRTIAAGGHEDWIVAYDLTNAPEAPATFSARIANATDVVADAPSGRLPRIDGAPVQGGTRTVLGGLTIATSPAAPPARTVQPTTPDIPVLAVRATAASESFDISEIVVTAQGSADDPTDIAAVTLIRDNDQSGTLTLGDDVLAGPSTFASDDSSISFAGLATTVASGTSEDWLVTVQLASDAPGGSTLRLRLDRVVATGVNARVITPAGVPIASNTLTFGGSLTVGAGPENPTSGTTSPRGTDVVLMQVRLTPSSEDVTLSAITFAASGSGDDSGAIGAARLYVDANRNGVVDPVADVALAAPVVFTADDAEITFNLGAAVIGAGTTQDWIVAYDFTGSAQAGDTFSLRLPRATAIDASAPSGPLPMVHGAPVVGGTFTVLGDLTVALGPNNPAADTAARGAVDVPLLQIAARGEQEGFQITSLTIRASGSMDDTNDILAVRLISDTNGNGQRDAGETVIAGPQRFAGDDGALTFAINTSVALGGTTNVLIVADLASSVVGGRTVRVRVEPGDVTAQGLGGRAVLPAGLPLGSAPLAAGGTLALTLGPTPPTDRIVRRSALGETALQVRLTSDTEAVELTGLALRASGTGDDAMGLARVELFADNDGNGRVDPGDPSLASGRFSMDDGVLMIPLSQTVVVGAPVNLLARVALTATPLGGETFSISVDPSDLTITSSSGAVVVTGARVDGPTLTTGGGFVIAAGAQMSSGGPINQAFSGVPALQVNLRADNENCTVNGLTVTAAGSIDDATDITAVRIVRDVNDNGLADFSDLLLGAPTTFAMDDGTATFSGLGRTIAINQSERWLVVYDLSGTASHRETLRARIAASTDVMVTCDVSSAVVPTGGPIEGNSFVVEEDGALTLSRGALTPAPAFVPRGAVRAPIMQVRLQALVHDLTVDRIVVTATTSAGAAAGVIATIDVFIDTNRDGRLDRTDTHLGTGAPVDAQGRSEFTPALPVTVLEPISLLFVANISSTATPGTQLALRIDSNSDVTARRPIGLVVTSGAPIVSELMTVAGDLNIALANTPTVTLVQNDATDLIALDLALSATSEQFNVTSLTLTTEGTMDPATSVAAVSIVEDENDDGLAGAGERRVALGLTFAQGARRLTVAGLSERVDPSMRARWLVVFTLAGTARVDRTMTVSVAANVDITAVGTRVGAASPIGAPLVGETYVIDRSLMIRPGPTPVPNAIVAANAKDVPALQLDVRAFNEDVTISRLSLRASGTLDDASGVRNVRLFADRNNDGRIDPGDSEVAQPARPAGDDGAITFSPLAERIPRNGRMVYLVVVELSGAGTAGESVTVSLDSDADVTAFGALSGAIGASGAPIRGARIDLVGALNVRVGPASPPGVGVLAGSSFAALQLELFTQGERVNVSQLNLRLTGSADDAQAVASARLWRDIDGDGIVSEQDAVIASATPQADDGFVTLSDLGLDIAANGTSTLLVELELTANAAPGGTIRVGLETNENVRATGGQSGAITTVGAPLEGSAFTIVKPLPDAGGGASPDEGCGCTTVAHRRASLPAGWWLLAIGALLVMRRRDPVGRSPDQNSQL